MINQLSRLLAPMRRKLALLVTRGVVKLINDAKTMQNLQVTGLAGELLDGVERIQQYGFTAHPHPDADCLILNVGADRSHPIVIAVDDRRYRLHLAEGEVALYDDLDQAVKLLRSGIVIEAPQGVIHNGDLSVNGNLDVTGTLTAPIINATTTLTVNSINMGTHVHGGVTTGGSSTGGPT